MQEEEIKKELVCNCNDEFKTGLCPIHHKDKQIIKDMIITDELLIPDEIKQIKGLSFKCPKCGEESLMHFYEYCPNCGVKVIIQSKRLTELINAAQK